MMLKGLEALLHGPVPIQCFVQVQHCARVAHALVCTMQYTGAPHSKATLAYEGVSSTPWQDDVAGS